MLVDSSVWIDFLRGGSSLETRILTDSLDHGRLIWLAPPILQEILQGADSSERFNKWRRILGDLPLLEARDMRALTCEAALLYATCRWQAFTPRSANDCLIAAYAIQFEIPLLHRDRDFVYIAKVESRLRLIPVA